MQAFLEDVRRQLVENVNVTMVSKDTGPHKAQRMSDERRRNAQKSRKMTTEVKGWINTLICQDLSPQQTVDYLMKNKKVSLHHETVYQYIYADKARGGNLYLHLRVASKPYRKRYGAYDSRGKIKNRVDIDARPAVVDRQNRVGDWEGDAVMGKGRKSALLTMVERKTLFTVIALLTGKRADLLADAAIKSMRHLKDKVKTVTLDNGLEFASHEKIANRLNADIYFAHPYCSWERGINKIPMG